jgi:hypothetical protein
MQAAQDRSDMLPSPDSGNQAGSSVLNTLQFHKKSNRNFIKKAVAVV